ncbi:MAG: class I SAM-dependent methyltransferase [Gemmatimonadetes bacterium]|nr:class I SAM-dependent methyltransferase [Gemmatimonadota bacterium]MBT4610095.1 class I SAM-dependent methyltransferase [Gemmatimonadota bacterium]MBT5058426.1 class I SAM-dependent methyltransferase [Gemmatimonadota bacterium]MBT5141248.1 class I SAM-dependent methyltransferase [Gemmatimonadota bacterium]MBT5588831.1 class I SAM-dependent methyltransferase [Gemmatimonadota bacterium]
MNQSYWDQLSSEFDDKVLQISQCDTKGVIADAAHRLRGRHKNAIDFGCGPGAVTRIISPHFNHTTGVDFSASLLQRARRLTTDESIHYERRNLEKAPSPKNPEYDVGFCVNVLIHEKAAIRHRICSHICSSIRAGGHLVLVVPSYESALRTYQALARCHQRDGLSPVRAHRRLDQQATGEMRSLTDGIIGVGGTATKHYLHDEIAEFLADHGAQIEGIERVGFPWSEEIDHAPPWLGAPTPWDWLVQGKITALRRKGQR